MKIQIISDFPLISNYNEILERTVGEVNRDNKTKITEAVVVESPGELDPDPYAVPTLLLGPRPAWLPMGYTVIPAPSIRATLGTAGGVTKLHWALESAATGQFDDQGLDYEWSPYDADTAESVGLPTGALIAVDIEVSGDVEVDEPEDTELLSVAVCWEEGDKIKGVVWNKEHLRAYDVQRILADSLANNQLLAHNGKFDFRWLNRHLEGWLSEPLYPDEDTIILHHAMYPGAGEHGLKPLAHRILGAADWEEGIKKYTKGSKAHYERIPQDILVKYNAYDVYWTLRIFRRLMELADDTALDLYRNHAMPASHMLQDVEAWGMAVDVPYAEELGAHLDSKIVVERAYLDEYVKNPNSPKQVLAAIKEEFGITLVSSAEKALLNSLQTVERKYGGQAEFAAVVDDYRTFIVSLLKHRSLTKERSTYVTSVLAKVRNGRVHPSFLVHGTVTGRLSSKGPNVQNVKNDDDDSMSKRRMYIAPDGYLLVGADYSQAELRTMAELSDDELMIADLQEDSPDFFDNMMPSVFPHIDFTVLDKAHRKPHRLKLKRVVYGTSYGLTAPSIAFALTLDGYPTSQTEAQSIQDGYLGRYIKLDEWRNNTMPLVLSGDELITPFGRRFQQDVITQATYNRVQNQAWAFRPQSIASDICLRAAMWIHREFEVNPEYKDCHIIATVHDAIYCEVPEHLAEQVMEFVQAMMRKSGAMTFHRIPFLTDAHASKYWNEC